MAPAAITAATPATGPRDGSSLVIGLKPGAREGATKVQLYGSKIPSRMRAQVFWRPALAIAARLNFIRPALATSNHLFATGRCNEILMSQFQNLRF